ncbi:MAG: alcohol dehydrogenase catalytic domain-containing protein [Actinomycetota bacterium]|nr:alcohol dehydrogenase catalytic domain-containing protein [Actinomycetota bacterium]
MRAVVLDADGLPEVAELPEPSGAGLLVRVRACGLCGSDVEKLGRAAPGTVLGHEVAGELENGARVTVMHRVPCGVCERCLAGHSSTCGEFRELRISPGGFAEELRATHCVPLPDSLGELDGVWIEPLACVLRAAELVPRGRVLVVGCGAIGRLWIQVLSLRGDSVVATDPRPDRLAGARGLGAEADGDSVAAAVLTAPAGADDTLRRLEPGGTLLVFAAPEGAVPTSLDAVYRNELHVVGSRSASPAFFRQAVEVLPSLVLPPVTALPLERFLEGVELYRRGDALKVVFTP